MSASRVSRLGGLTGVATTAFSEDTTVASGTRTRLTIATIPEGKEVVSTSLGVATVSDPGGDLDVGLYNGQEQVTPEGSRHTMATDEVTLPGVGVFETGDDVDVELDNRDNTSSIQVSVFVGAIEADKSALMDVLGESG